MKNIRFFNLKISLFGGKIFSIFEYACLRNRIKKQAVLGCNYVHVKKTHTTCITTETSCEFLHHVQTHTLSVIRKSENIKEI